jgi:hypothetical protein
MAHRWSSARGVEILLFQEDGDPPGGEVVAPGLEPSLVYRPQTPGHIQTHRGPDQQILDHDRKSIGIDKYAHSAPCSVTRQRIRQNLLDPADDTVLQAHLDAVRMYARLSENILDDAFGQSARTLILFLDDLYMSSHVDI